MTEKTPGTMVETSAAPGAGPRPRASWAPYLVVVMLVELVLLLHLLPNDPAVHAQIERWKAPLYRAQEARARAEQARRLAALMRDDPRLGARPIPEESALFKEIPQRSAGGEQPTILLFIGACSSCVARDLLAWRDAAAKRGKRPLVVISRDTPEAIAEFRRSYRCSLPIVSDVQGQVSKRFSVLWVPRAYAVASDGRLTWIQTDPTVGPEVAIEQVWGTRKG